MIEVRNPRTGRFDHTFEPPSDAQLDAFTAASRRAHGAWIRLGAEGRGQVLLELAASIEEYREPLLSALVHDTGRRIESVLEIEAVLGMLRRWARTGPEALIEEAPWAASIPGFSISQDFEPFQLVAVISPWNFPLLLGCIDAIPALAAGCAVTVKPSELTPRFIAPLSQAIERVSSLRDVLRFVEGDGHTGGALIDRSDLVCFTGSVATGRKVAIQAATRFIPAFLELGGKDPAIVTSSADIDRASSAILWGGTANAGQSCLSIERIYVDSSIADEFVAALSQKANVIKLAAPNLEDGQLGPIIAERQVAIIRDHLRDATARGAKVITGGSLETIDGGSYLRPTVLTDVDHSMLVMREETFGPILPVAVGAGEDELIRLANDSSFGLSAAVFADTVEDALRVASRIHAGGISINDAALTALIHDAEKQSFKDSGLGGSRMGAVSLRRFGRRKGYLIAQQSQPDPWWFPQLRR